MIAIGDEDVVALHGSQLVPARTALKQRHLLKRSGPVEAARVHDNDIRKRGNNHDKWPRWPGVTPAAILTDPTPGIIGRLVKIAPARQAVLEVAGS